jgi:hypothetical protein
MWEGEGGGGKPVENIFEAPNSLLIQQLQVWRVVS